LVIKIRKHRKKRCLSWDLKQNSQIVNLPKKFQTSFQLKDPPLCLVALKTQSPLNKNSLQHSVHPQRKILCLVLNPPKINYNNYLTLRKIPHHSLMPSSLASKNLANPSSENPRKKPNLHRNNNNHQALVCSEEEHKSNLQVI
jgi:hypothetical protein